MAKKIDLILLGATGSLLIFGILMIASVSASFSQEKFGTTYYYLNHQLISILIGLTLGFIAFKINPDFAVAIDTTVAGDMPYIKETESAIRLGDGVAITILEASGRGLIVSEKIKNMCIEEARKNKIKYQVDVIDGGMTDGAVIYMNREGIPTAVLAIPSRYIHSPCGIFNLDDIDAAVQLAIKVITRVHKP